MPWHINSVIGELEVNALGFSIQIEMQGVRMSSLKTFVKLDKIGCDTRIQNAPNGVLHFNFVTTWQHVDERIAGPT